MKSKSVMNTPQCDSGRPLSIVYGTASRDSTYCAVSNAADTTVQCTGQRTL